MAQQGLDETTSTAAVLVEARVREFVAAMADAGNPGAARYGSGARQCYGWAFDVDPSWGGRDWIVVAADGFVYSQADRKRRRVERHPVDEWLLEGSAPTSPISRAIEFTRRLEAIMIANRVPIPIPRAEPDEFLADLEEVWTDAEMVFMQGAGEIDERELMLEMDATPEEDLAPLDEAPADETPDEAKLSHPSTASVTRERTGQIIEALLVVLGGHPEGLAANEVIALLEKRLPLTDFERSDYPNNPGVRRFDKIVKFTAIPPTKAGWITVDGGTWNVTPDGASMIGHYDDPADLAREATRLYREWKKRGTAPNEAPEPSVADPIIVEAPAPEPEPEPEPELESMPERDLVPGTGTVSTSTSPEDADEAAWTELENLVQHLRNIVDPPRD